jgi:hypothetical protein
VLLFTDVLQAGDEGNRAAATSRLATIIEINTSMRAKPDCS